MTGAMYAAIGGLKSHMSKLNVIGNNIANVNTYGYKTQRMTFQESMYNTSKAGSNGGETKGGNNPSQIGYGSTVGSIDLNMAPSTYAPTGYGLDCMLMNEGFFLTGTKDGTVNTSADLSSLNLSRLGDFRVDNDGYICDRRGNVLYGFATVQNPYYDPADKSDPPKMNPDGSGYVKDPTIISTELVPLRLPLSAAVPTVENGGYPAGTTADQIAAGTAKPNWQTGAPVYSVLGEPDTNNNMAASNIAGNAAAKGPKDGAWTPDADGVFDTTRIAANGENKCVQLESMSIDPTGAIIGINKNGGETVVVGYVAVASVDSPDGVTHTDGPYYKAMGGAGDVRVGAMGGVLKNRYLSNRYVADPTKDTIAVSEAIQDDSGEIKNSGLEASSTDVATEFSEMITTQRGYQANTRIITVTDSMLEELVNMKR